MNKNALKLVEILGEKFGAGTVTKAQIVDTAKGERNPISFVDLL
jgi:hypothetical protein